MKKNLLLYLAAALLLACGTRNKSEPKSVGLRGFSVYYNTLFNSKEALEAEVKARKLAHKDNFYAPYIRILTTEDQPLGVGSEEEGPAFGAEMNFAPPGAPQRSQNAKSTTTILQISEAKALKAISKYSVMKEGQEKNKMLFDAHILLAQARLYEDKPLEALDALNYLFSHMSKDRRIDLAKIYQGAAYAQMKDYYRANEVFMALEKLPKKYEAQKTVYYAQMLVDSGKKEQAAAELENAFSANKNRRIRSRIAFLRGQLLASMDKKEEARESFVTAYKYAGDFEFEVKSQVEIAKTYNGKNGDFEGAKNYLEGIAKKGTYGSRKNELYYALGLVAESAGKTDNAQAYFKKALAEKISDPQIRGLTYYEIGRDYFSKNDYLGAGAYYDSAVAAMTYGPSKDALAAQASNIKNITKNYYLIQKNDSILALTRMPLAERETYFSKYIDKIRSKENAALAQQKRDAHSKGFDTGDYNANSIFATQASSFADFGKGSKGFYFANQSAISRGEQDFRQLWGSRAQQDNWRYSSRTASLEDARSQSMGQLPAQDPRRFEPSYYIEKIPTDQAEILALKKSRDTASLGLGRMYDAYFGNTPLATKTLYELADARPEDEVRLQALYQIFAMNYEKNPAAAERAKNLIISDFPYTQYAEFVKNPRNTSFSKSAPDVEQAYIQAYNLYDSGKYEESRAAVEAALSKYPKDALVPKFALLNAYNAGKTAGKEIMILQLQQIALNYAKSPEGEKARDMLGFLKSDLEVNATDAAGAPLPTQTPPGQNAIAPMLDELPDPRSKSLVRQQQDISAAVRINTSENVVQPLQDGVMPTSPPANPADPQGRPPRPPRNMDRSKQIEVLK